MISSWDEPASRLSDCRLSYSQISSAFSILSFRFAQPSSADIISLRTSRITCKRLLDAPLARSKEAWTTPLWNFEQDVPVSIGARVCPFVSLCVLFFHVDGMGSKGKKRRLDADESERAYVSRVDVLEPTAYEICLDRSASETFSETCRASASSTISTHRGGQSITVTIRKRC
jgi:hypothetical protein